MTVAQVFDAQQNFFNSNSTKDISWRLKQLSKLENLLKQNEEMLYEAIKDDFEKSQFETYVTELSFIYSEIAYTTKHLKSWAKRKKVATGLANFPARSYIIPEPLGTCLVIGAWNYPYQLSLLPAVAALAAGNTVIIKPSEMPARTAAAMAQIINTNFDPKILYVAEGAVEMTTELLKLKFDKIFFTGSTAVGKIIYKAAAENLVPVTLELGGKSPTFVCADADIAVSAQRIVWAKFLNAGQTCVAPDFIMVEKSIEQKFLIALKEEIEKRYSNIQVTDDHYLQIINDKNFKRLTGLIDQSKVFYGGQTNSENRFIAPTIMQNVTFEDKVMQEEIFGPILPVISFDSIEEAIAKVKAQPKPLSLYIYSKSSKTIDKLLSELSFGSGAVNDSLMQLSNHHLPFGGVGNSGMGSYHGKTSFDNFSHFKSILHKPFWFESSMKYAPYTDMKLKLVKWIMG
ncbi:aldehyde dehydrogenase [Flavobacterium ardleyense]|uniref:aldehyde dehydrogenase n=1 Tax=Flavobacterium ardleyense TaxID=2038737 RepID=UPI00298CF410|nr:aldehyde dehydrogenase [Flavobacterium ardleyense]